MLFLSSYFVCRQSSRFHLLTSPPPDPHTEEKVLLVRVVALSLSYPSFSLQANSHARLAAGAEAQARILLDSDKLLVREERVFTLICFPLFPRWRDKDSAERSRDDPA